MAGEPIDLKRIQEIVRGIERGVVAHVERHGYSPALRQAYEAYWADVQELWRLVIVEAKQSGASAEDIRTLKRQGYSFRDIRLMLEELGRRRREADLALGSKFRPKRDAQAKATATAKERRSKRAMEDDALIRRLYDGPIQHKQTGRELTGKKRRERVIELLRTEGIHKSDKQVTESLKRTKKPA